MNCMQFNETDQQVKLEFKDVSYFSSGEGGTTDHSKLINRDVADQHPMSAITGLEDALSGKQPTGNYLTEEQDPTVPEWAKQPQKPAYTAQEVGALPANTHIPSTAAEVNAEPSGAVAQHNVSDAAHSDIRLLIQGLSERLSSVADSDDTTLDQLSEIVAYIKSNKSLIDAITTSKVNVADIVDNLTTNVANKPLSAAQGVALKAIIDALTIPTALSELTEDTTHRVVTDTEKAVWNAKSNFNGSYNDLTDKPTIPEAYTLPIASHTVLGGVQPVAKTSDMTQSVGVDETGALWAPAASGGGSGGGLKLITEITTDAEVKYIYQSFDPITVSELIVVMDVVSPETVNKGANGVNVIVNPSAPDSQWGHGGTSLGVIVAAIHSSAGITRVASYDVKIGDSWYILWSGTQDINSKGIPFAVVNKDLRTISSLRFETQNWVNNLGVGTKLRVFGVTS